MRVAIWSTRTWRDGLAEPARSFALTSRSWGLRAAVTPTRRPSARIAQCVPSCRTAGSIVAASVSRRPDGLLSGSSSYARATSPAGCVVRRFESFMSGEARTWWVGGGAPGPRTRPTRPVSHTIIKPDLSAAITSSAAVRRSETRRKAHRWHLQSETGTCPRGDRMLRRWPLEAGRSRKTGPSRSG